MGHKFDVSKINMSKNKAKIKLAIVDDHKLFRSGLISLLDEYGVFEISFEASNGLELLQLYESHKPDVVCLDIEMPVMNGIEATTLLKQKYPEARIVYLTQYDEDQFILHLIRTGGNGYLLKNADIDVIVDGLLTVAKNKYYFDCKFPKHYIKQLLREKVIMPEFNKSELTNREKEILRMICAEFITREIAERLFISQRTVDRHRENIMLKIGARNAYGMIMYGIKHQLI